MRFPELHANNTNHLAAIARSAEMNSKKSLGLLLRQNGYAKTPKNIDTLAACAASQQQVANRKPKPAKPNTKTLAERLYNFRRQAVIATAKQTLRHGAAAGTTWTVNLCDIPTEIGYCCTTWRDYNVYRGQFKGWAALGDAHSISVPATWRCRVERRGLAIVDGLMTLDAVPLEAPKGVELYGAIWAAQGRGYDVKVQHGFIARAAGSSYHGASVEQTLQGLARKMGATRKTITQSAQALMESVSSFCARFEKADCEVSVADARRTGSCEYGIRSWCDAVGLDYTKGKATMQEVLAGFRLRPQREVRLAILHAARQARPMLKKAA